MDLSQRLTQIMNDRGVSAYKLWQGTKMPQATIGRWKNGKATPSSENLQILADFFKVSTDYLLGNTDDPTPADKKNASLIDLKEGIIQELIKRGKIAPDKTLSDKDWEAILSVAEALANHTDK